MAMENLRKIKIYMCAHRDLEYLTITYKMHADPQNIHILVFDIFHRALQSE